MSYDETLVACCRGVEVNVLSRRFVIVGFACLVLGAHSSAQASLIVIGKAVYDGSPGGAAEQYNLIYDTDRSLTWLDFVHGGDTWQNQMAWAGGLNGSGVITYLLNEGVTMNWASDWRLPSAGATPQGGYDYQSGNELGHLYFNEMGLPAGGYGDEGLYNFGPFQNLNPYERPILWESNVFIPESGSGQTEGAWAFNFMGGNHGGGSYSNEYRGLAVRSGSASFAPVPEPLTLSLAVASLGLFMQKRRYRQR